MLDPSSSPSHASRDPHPVLCCATTLLLILTTTVLAQSAPNQKSTGGAAQPAPGKSAEEQQQPKPDESASSMAALMQLNNALEGLAAKVSPAVVQILVTGYGPLHEENRTQTALIVRQHAVGSGLIVDSNGYIITNAHVVEGAQRIRVALPLPGDSGRAVPVGKRHILEARLVGVHKDTDLALLKIDEKDLPTLPLLSQQRPHVGQLVFAIGSPEGLQNSVTMGVVSAVARQPDPDKALTYIQTDAPINPGNSGGPLVNIHGEVIGINTAIASRSGGFQGIGFAIPSNQAKGVFTALREHHMVVRGWLGISLQDVDDNPDLAKSFGYQGERGVIVSGVAPNGPSENKLLPQDIVTAFNGQPVADGQQLRNLVAGVAPGTTANITVFRDSKEQQVQVVVGTQPKNLAAAMEGSSGGGEAEITGENQTLQALGMSLATLDKQTAQKIGIDSGAVITEVKHDGLAFNAGLSPGDVITMVFKTPVHSAAEAAEAINAADLKKGVRLYVFTHDQEGHHMYRFVFIKSADTSPQ